MLIANDQDKLQEIVTRVKEESSKAGLEMNVKKTKTMIISRDPEGKKVDIKVDNKTIQQVEKFIYLGTLILEEIKTDKEIERRKNIAKEKFSSMAKILKSKRSLSEYWTCMDGKTQDCKMLYLFNLHIWV